MAALNLEDYQNGEQDEATDTYTIYAPQHKTVTAGPTPLTMTFILFEKLRTFVNDVQAILKTDSDNLFLTQEGKAFNEGTLGQTITSFWKKTGVRPDFLMTSTRLRKIGKSTTTKNTDAEKWLVHRHMTHIKAKANWFNFHNNHCAQGHGVLQKNIAYSEDQAERMQRS